MSVYGTLLETWKAGLSGDEDLKDVSLKITLLSLRNCYLSIPL